MIRNYYEDIMNLLTFITQVFSQKVGTLTDFTSQVILKPIIPHTQKEQVEYSLAAERRRVRMVHDDIIKDLLSHGSDQQGRCDVHGHNVVFSRHHYMKDSLTVTGEIQDSSFTIPQILNC